MKETYQQLTARQSKEFSELDYLFFAFSNQQLKEGMQKLGLDMDSKEDQAKMLSVGHGGYILKAKREEFRAFIDRQRSEKQEALKDTAYLVGALVYELGNHEYGYTGDSSDAVESVIGGLGYDTETDVFKKALHEAKARANALSCDF